VELGINCETSKKKRNTGLDVVRGLAILLVLISHSIIYGDYPDSVKNCALNCGYCGVTLFFVLSGFLITGILIKEEAEFCKISLYNFYWRRALRLFPALWIYIATVYIIWSLGLIDDHPWHSFITSLFYIRNLIGRGHETDHLWSLSIEEQFYFAWPILFIFTGRFVRVRFWITFVLISAVGVWRIYAGKYGIATFGALYIRSDFRIDAPLAGSLLAQMVFRKMRLGFYWDLRPFAKWGGVISLLLLGWLVTCTPSNNMLSGAFSILVLFICLSLVLFAYLLDIECNFFAYRYIILLGTYSYGIYLWQQLFLGPNNGVIGEFRSPVWGIPMCVFFAWCSFNLIEKKFLSFKDAYFHKSK